MHCSRGLPHTCHVTDHALITWISCTDHVAEHALFTWRREAKISACEEENDIINGMDMVFGKCQFCGGVQGELKKRGMRVLEVRGSRKPILSGYTQRDRVLTSHPGYGQASRNDEATVRREE